MNIQELKQKSSENLISEAEKLGIERYMTNRAHRSLEMFGPDKVISKEDIFKYKYDMKYSENSAIAQYVDEILDANLPLSIGFINIPAFLIFIPITTFMARVGANTIHRVDKTKVQAFFGIFLYVVGTIFIYRYLNL